MSANTIPDSPRPGAPPTNMPPPPPGTGLTSGPAQAPAPAPAPAPVAQGAPGPAQAAPAPAAAPAPEPDAKAAKEAAKAAKAEAKAADKAAKAQTKSVTPTTSTRAGTSFGGRLLMGVIWGPLAMGAAALLLMWDSAVGGDLAVRPLRFVVTLLEGGPGLVDGSPVVGIAINIVLGVVLGLLFALVAGRFRTSRGVLVGALVFGAGVFAVDFYVISAQLPLLALRDEVILLASRLVFGAVLAIGFVGLPDRRG